MNIKDILSSDEEVLFKAQQHRMVPGGKETAPGEIFVTTKRIIIETSSWMGIKKQYEDLHFSDIDEVILKKNIFSANIIIKSRFQGELHLSGIGKKEAQQMEQLISQKIDQYRYGYGGGPQNQDGGVRR